MTNAEGASPLHTHRTGHLTGALSPQEDGACALLSTSPTSRRTKTS